MSSCVPTDSNKFGEAGMLTDLVHYSFKPEYGDAESVSISEETDSEGGAGGREDDEMADRVGHWEWCTCGM